MTKILNAFEEYFGTDPRYLARKNDPGTSHEAAAAVDSKGLEKLVYDTLLEFGLRGGISDDVLKKHKNLPYSSITARYKALMTKGFIEDTGERRRGRSGRNQRVLRAIIPTDIR